MKRALLTGASGFLGKYIHQQLKENNYAVDTLGRSSESTIVCDLSQDTLINLPNQYELIVHAAGKAHSVPKTAIEAAEFYNVNYLGTKKLLNSLENKIARPALFVFISTVAVYGVESGTFISEIHPLQGSTPYALSKIQSEDVVVQWCDKHEIPFLILRLPLVVGANAPGNLGAMENAIIKGRYLNIAGGTANKSMVLADDIARLIASTPQVSGIYNLTDGEHPTFSALASAIAEKYNKTQPKNIPRWLAKLIAHIGDILGARAPLNSDKLLKITSSLTFDDSLAKEKLGWTPKRVLADYAG